jgi:Ca2+-binding RTX toxin-like protein
VRIQRAIHAGAGVLVAVSLSVPAANASRVDVVPDFFDRYADTSYIAAPGEANDLRTGNFSGPYARSAWIDRGATIEAGSHCRSVRPHIASCDHYPFANLTIDLGDGDDSLHDGGLLGVLVRPSGVWADGGPGDDHLVGAEWPDRLTGGTGRDTLEGGAGADRITSHEPSGEAAVADTVSCGDGLDYVSADFLDVVAGDCETVARF